MGISVLLLTACNNSPKQESNGSSDTTKNVSSKAPQNNAAVSPILEDYLHLKNALASDDDAAAAQAGNAMVKSLTTIQEATLTTGQQKIFDEISSDIKEHAEHIASNKGNIKHQREHFETLSTDLYDLLKAGDKIGKKLYYTNCPMYNKGKGGNWISETAEIKNPYYGKQMSDCGSVKEEL